MANPPGIFLSHSHVDKPFVRKLAAALSLYGVKVWVDEAEILLGDSLVQKISSAIEEMDYVGAVISRHSVQSHWVTVELEQAMDLEIRSRKVKILPLLIDDCEMPPFLKKKLYADFRNADQFEQGVNAILRRLGISKPLAPYVQNASSDVDQDKTEPKRFPDLDEGMTFAEELFLLCVNAETGLTLPSVSTYGSPAALIGEVIYRKKVTLTTKGPNWANCYLIVSDRTPVGERLLDKALLAVIAATEGNQGFYLSAKLTALNIGAVFNDYLIGKGLFGPPVTKWLILTKREFLARREQRQVRERFLLAVSTGKRLSERMAIIAAIATTCQSGLASDHMGGHVWVSAREQSERSSEAARSLAAVIRGRIDSDSEDQGAPVACS